VSGLRGVLPRLLIAVLLVSLVAVLFVLQRSSADAERRLEQPGSSVAVPAAAASDTPDPADDWLERVAALGLSPSRLALGALVLASLVAALLVWLALDASQRRERRERSDDGRARREQAAILTLLDEIGPLASGDLRVRATVSEAMTGALADAFNHAVGELRWLVGTVDTSATKIGEAVRRSRESARRSVEACTEQGREIHRSSNYLGTMSETMSELSAHAAESSRIASASVDEAEAGGVAIRENVERLSRIREEAERATGLMQRLADNATAIDERVDTIRDVARRTDLLALNTTIRAAASASASAHAARSGVAEGSTLGSAREPGHPDRPDAGASGECGAAAPDEPRDARSDGRASASGDLSRLSDEVTQLADLLGGAARDIASLSRTIRQDAEDTVRAMDETNRELAAGFAQAEQASGAFESIQAVLRELQRLVREMADKALRQSGVVRQLSSNMGAINRVTFDTSRNVQETADALDTLNEMSLELRDGVADFRLPTPPRSKGPAQRRDAAAADPSDPAPSETRVLDHG